MVQRVPFHRAIQDVTGGNLRLQTSDYQRNGTIPVIDQGQALVAGYTENESAICQRQGAVILFGDHTRTFKYVDFDFALGADGVKVLQCRDGFDPRYLFHYLRTVQLPENLGYSRHFKFLKECEVPKPELAEQQRIATILDKADSLRSKRQEAISLADNLLSVIFIDMFGDPLKNPKGWPMVKFADVGELNRGKSRHRPRDDQRLYGDAYPFIQTGDVANSGGLITKYSQSYSDFGLSQSRLWRKGTLCITIAANIGKTGILNFDACFPDSIVGFVPGDAVRVDYIQFWLESIQAELERTAPQSAQKNINLDILSRLDVALPPLSVQDEFSVVVTRVRRMKSRYEESQHELELLSRALSAAHLA